VSPARIASRSGIAGLPFAAARDGGRRALTLPPAVQADPGTLADEEREAVGARRLPADLSEAADALADSAFARHVLGADLHDAFVATRRSEWETLHELDRSALIDFHELRYG
jgi:glutamine synthetase